MSLGNGKKDRTQYDNYTAGWKKLQGEWNSHAKHNKQKGRAIVRDIKKARRRAERVQGKRKLREELEC